MIDDNAELHLDAIDRHVRALRGEEVSGTPWDFQLPTAAELRSMREECGLTREEMGDISGYSPDTITAVETARQPPGRQYITTALRVYKREWPL